MIALNFPTTCVWLLVGMLGLSGCGRRDAPDLQPGKSCTIIFRRDALGATTNLPSDPIVSLTSSMSFSVTGILKRTNNDWIVIEQGHDHPEVWVPTDVVLPVQQ